MKRNTLSIELIRRLFHYDPISGDLSWKLPGRGRTVGKAIRADNGHGYYITSYNKEKFLVHRIAFAHYHGWWPEYIDHKDLTTTHNWIDNLRPSTVSQNSQNSIKSASTNEVKGVHWNYKKKKYQVRITVNKKLKHLGFYLNKEDAIKARIEAERIFFGEFAPIRSPA